MIIHHDYSLGLTWDCSCAEVKGAAAATAGGLQGPPAIFINIVSEVTAVCVCVCVCVCAPAVSPWGMVSGQLVNKLNLWGIKVMLWWVCVWGKEATLYNFYRLN